MIVKPLQLFFQISPDFLEEFFRGSGKCISAFWQNVKICGSAQTDAAGSPVRLFDGCWQVIFKVWEICDFGPFWENAFGMSLFGRNVKNLRFRQKRCSYWVSVSVRQHVNRFLKFLQKRATEKACRERAFLPRGSLHRSLFFNLGANAWWNPRPLPKYASSSALFGLM